MQLLTLFWCLRERDVLKDEALEAHAAVAKATAELKRLRASMAATQQRAAAQLQDLQGQLKAAEAATR